MSEFNNVSIIKKANIYFDGKVSSRTIKFSDGTSKTLGFMIYSSRSRMPRFSTHLIAMDVVVKH